MSIAINEDKTPRGKAKASKFTQANKEPSSICPKTLQGHGYSMNSYLQGLITEYYSSLEWPPECPEPPKEFHKA